MHIKASTQSLLEYKHLSLEQPYYFKYLIKTIQRTLNAKLGPFQPV